MKSIIIKEICFILLSNNVQTLERRHVALLPKYWEIFFATNFASISASLRTALFVLCFALPNVGSSQSSPLVFNVTDSVASFTSYGVIELNRCNDRKNVSISYLVDSLKIGENLIGLENRKVSKTVFGYLVSFNTQFFEGYISFDSDGLSDVVVYSGKNKDKMSVYTTNYIDAKAEFLNTRHGSRNN